MAINPPGAPNNQLVVAGLCLNDAELRRSGALLPSFHRESSLALLDKRVSRQIYYADRGNKDSNAVGALRYKSAEITLLSATFVFLLASMPHAFAFSNGQAASLVIGDSSLTSFKPGATSTGLVGPYSLAFDSEHNL